MTEEIDNIEQKKSYEVQVQLCENDFYSFQRLACETIQSKVATIIATCFILSLIISNTIIETIKNLKLLELNSSYEFINYELILLIALSIPLMYILFRFFNTSTKESNFHPNGNLLSPKTVHIDYNGITEQNNVRKGHSKWSGVHDIYDDDNIILIFIDKMQAYIIPKHSFDTEEDANAFLKQARHYWQLKTNKAPKNPWDDNNKDKDHRDETDPQ